MMWVGNSSTHDENRLVRLAAVFVALRQSLEKLGEYYKYVVDNIDNIAPINVRNLEQPHPRLYPYATTYVKEDREVEFEYIQALEDDPACVTFLARTKDTAEPNIVVKFVSQYGSEAHSLLASQGDAPRLHYHGPMPDQYAMFPRSSLVVPDGSAEQQHLPLMQMVVMEYIKASKDVPLDARGQITKVLKKLHDNGFVFGDLRRPNTLFDEGRKVKLVDFDWAGRYRRDQQGLPVGDDGNIHQDDKLYSHYPTGLSRVIKWPEGAEPFSPIHPDHDMKMLDIAFPPC